MDLLWLAREDISMKKLEAIWQNFVENIEENNLLPMPEEYEEEEAKEFANSKIGFFVNLIAENDQLLTKYFENDRGIFFKQCIFYKWIQDEEWEKISEYIVKSLMAFDDQNNKFDYGYMNMLSPYMDGDLTGEYMDRTDQWGRIIKIINESNIEKFVDALCKASAMTVGCENHEKYHKRIKEFVEKTTGDMSCFEKYGFLEKIDTRSGLERLKAFTQNFLKSGKREIDFRVPSYELNSIIQKITKENCALLQNADDAGAKRVCVSEIDNAVIVANDGRPFDENDIMSICRSGASNKRRGNSIGYRGVGFKSATVISTEIVIYSAGVYFTFSKSLCAKTLHVSCDKVPTVRIPFIYDETKLNFDIKRELLRLQSEGFNTAFIFLKANVGKFVMELREFDSSWLLFLKNIVHVEIDMEDIELKCSLKRKNIHDFEKLITVEESGNSWYVINNGDIAVAFLYDSRKGLIPCQVDDAVFHCFLPMLDKTGFAFKINADFSTDPSRKHLIQDDLTTEAFAKAAKLLASFIENVFKRKDEKLYGLLGLIGKHISLTNTSIAFEKELLSELVWREWIPLEKGTCVKAKEVKLFPSWMSEKERKVFLDGIPSFKENYISHLLYEQSDEHFLLLKKLGAEEISDGKLRNIITDGKVVSGLSVELIAKIFVYEGRSCFTDEKWVGEVCLPTESGFVSVRDCYTDSSVNGEYCKVLQQLLSDDEWSTLITQFPVFEQIKKYRVKRSSGGTQLKRNSSKKAQLAINKWKTPIQNCMAAETMNGFSVKDVSKKCDEYSLICANANGDTRYVLVIPVAHIGDTIKLSESQYSAAQRIGESYELFVIATEASEAEYIYIKNPYEKVELNRVVKEWEWVCDKYDKEKQIQPVTEVEVVDDYILKNILPDYFNRQQRNFLQDIIMSEDDINYDDKYKISIEQINSISDFYTSRKMIDVINGKIMISMDKKAALKKILGI